MTIQLFQMVFLIFDAAYSSSETYDWGGSEVTYYADDGSVLGYANVSTWDNGWR